MQGLGKEFTSGNKQILCNGSGKSCGDAHCPLELGNRTEMQTNVTTALVAQQHCLRFRHKARRLEIQFNQGAQFARAVHWVDLQRPARLGESKGPGTEPR